MFHPVGSQPPSVYWRRRIILLGSVVLLIVLVVLTVNAMNSGTGGSANAGGSSPTASSSAFTPTPSTVSSKPSTPTKTSASSTKSSARSTSAAPPARCVAGNLQVRAVSAKPTYRVGDTPTLQLQVTNTGPRACVQDLADKQVELRVYNGESRVWGSHDCKIVAGTSDRTLTPQVSVLVSIKWSGLTSQKGCKGTRQRVGAGTYTLYALLSGRQGHASQFSIS
jgi:hypothetical protein